MQRWMVWGIVCVCVCASSSLFLGLTVSRFPQSVGRRYGISVVVIDKYLVDLILKVVLSVK